MANNPIAVPGTVVPSGVYVSPGGPQGFQGQPGPVGLTGAATSFFGTDSTNNQAYAVSIAGNFSMNAGVIVFVSVTNTNLANPTLNVNGLGAKAIYDLSGLPVGAGVLKLFGVFWDNTYWRKFS
jgi:hypothetical protein